MGEILQSGEGGVAGVGIDLCDVARIQRLLSQYPDAFLERNFAPAERQYCMGCANPAQHLAARFAAKEAMAKALGTGFSGGITPRGLWLESDPQTAAPIARLDEAATKRMLKLGGRKMLVSITHLKDYAQAIAVITK